MKRLRKVSILLLCAVLSCAMFACKEKTITAPRSSLPDYDAKKGELHLDIAGWCTPDRCVPKDLTNEEQLAESERQFALMRDAGLNVIHANYSGDGTLSVATGDVRESDAYFYNKLHEYGLGTYINLGRSPEALSAIGAFKEYPAVLGYQYDEPSTSGEIEAFAAQLETFNANANGKTLVINMQPPTGKFNEGMYSYEEQIDEIADMLTKNLGVGSERWISADHYVLNLKDGVYSLAPAYLGNVNYVAKYGTAYGFKKNYFMQTMPYSSGAHDRVPGYEEIRLQEYALLAFGMDGISQFCYQTPMVNPEFSETQVAMIDREGNPTPIYDAAKKANLELRDFEHVYLQFDWKGVFTCDKGKTESARSRTSYDCFSTIADRLSVEDVASVNSVSASEHTLFGYFGDRYGNDGFMVVNYNDPQNVKSSTVTVNFNAQYGYNKAIVYVGGKKTEKDIRYNKLNLELGAGEGVFVIPYTA